MNKSVKVLYLVHRVPFPPDKGDRIRSYHVLRRLCDFAAVDVAFLTDEKVPVETINALGTLCDNVHVYDAGRVRRWLRASMTFATGRSATEGLFYSRQLQRDVDEWRVAGCYDAIVIFSSSMVPYVMHPQLRSRVVADLVDVDSEKFFDYAAHSAGLLAWLYRHEGKRVRRLERFATSLRAVVLATVPEAELFKQVVPGSEPVVIQNGVDLNYFSPRNDIEPDPYTCVFMGALDYRANVTGLEWFCNEVWPHLRPDYPNSEFRIVGRRPVARVRALDSIDGVNVVGEVPDVRPWLQSSSVAVAPLLVARGVQNKVLEAMACGVPVIGTASALNGLACETDVDAVEANSPQEWSAALDSIWNDKTKQHTLAINARKYVEQYHNWDVCLSRMEEIVRCATDQALPLA